jgi:hypothetical protein
MVVRGSTPMDSTLIYKPNDNINVPRGTIPFVNKMPRVKTKFSHICHLDVQSTPTTSAFPLVGLYPCHISLYGLYRLYNQQLFLLIRQIEQNTISHSFDVRLNPFEVRWVREDEAYTLAHFEVIPNTFISGLNFDPH